MKFILSLFFILIIGINGKFNSILNDGINKLYSFKIDDANEQFNQLIKISPDDPRGYYYKSLTHLWTYLGSKEPGEFDAFLVYSDSAKNLMDEIDSIDNHGYLADFWKGNIYSQRAIAYSTKGNTIDAFWATKNAVGFYEDAIEKKHDFYDAYLGIGIFDYALSFVPSIFKWGLSLTGLTADKEKGFRKIRLAQQKGNLVKVEATYHLAKLYLDYVAEYDSAKILLSGLLKSYPNNTLFLFQYALTLINNKEFSEAEEILNSIIDINNQHFKQTTAYSYFLLGEIYFFRNKFTKAINYYELFIKNANSVDYIGLVSLRMAFCYKMLNSSTEYKKYLILARNGNLDLDEDSYSKEFSEYLFNENVSEKIKNIIKSENYLLNGQNEKAIENLNPIVDSLKENNWKGRALILLSESKMNLGMLNDAFNFASRAISLNYGVDKWILPKAFLLKAKAYYLINNIREAQKYLTKAEDNNDFHFNVKIEAQINNLKRKIKNIKTK